MIPATCPLCGTRYEKDQQWKKTCLSCWIAKKNAEKDSSSGTDNELLTAQREVLRLKAELSVLRLARPQTTGTSAAGKHAYSTKFIGTDNPRELRAIHALMRRPMPREHLDNEVGCSNGPDLISNLRAKGLEIPCTRVPDLDRDRLPMPTPQAMQN